MPPRLAPPTPLLLTRTSHSLTLPLPAPTTTEAPLGSSSPPPCSPQPLQTPSSPPPIAAVPLAVASSPAPTPLDKGKRVLEILSDDEDSDGGLVFKRRKAARVPIPPAASPQGGDSFRDCSVWLTWDVFVRNINRQLGTPSHWLPVDSCKEGQKGALAAVCTPTLKSAIKKHHKLCTSVSEHRVWYFEGGKKELCLVSVFSFWPKPSPSPLSKPQGSSKQLECFWKISQKFEPRSQHSRRYLNYPSI